MSIAERIQNLIAEPAPDYVFEITENSVAAASPSDPSKQRQEILNERAAYASPAAPNMSRPQTYREALARIATLSNNPRRRAAALVIPDYAVRMTVIDLEDFPASEADRLALLRFRLRKTVPFPIDEARLSYTIQQNQPKQIEVLTVTVARPILEEYESLLTDAGFRVGMVMPSSIAALKLSPPADGAGMTVIAKIAGSVLSVLLVNETYIKVTRCVDLADGTGRLAEGEAQAVIPLLQQTLAFAEDQLGKPVTRLLLCGFGPDTEVLGLQAQKELGVTYAPLRSRYGTASQVNAGLLGLLERYAA